MTSRETYFAVLGALAMLLLLAIGAGAVATLGLYGVAADTPHTTLVRHFIAYARERAIEVRASGIAVPPLGNPEMIADGASDYDEMCTGCHLAPGMAENEMRPGLNPRPPLLARGQPANPAIAFWTIKHGIRMTAMPAWGLTHSDAEIWNMVAFLQILPKLSPSSYHALVEKAAGHHHHEMGGHDDHMKM